MNFTVKKNQVFKSTLSDNRIRVRSVLKNEYGPARYSDVEVVNINEAGRPIKNTERTIYQGSIQRRYEAA